jgi:hypothetical protein
MKMKISELLKLGENNINLELEDLDRIFEYEGFAYLKTLQCKQLSECIDEIKKFKYKPKGIIINFQTNEKVLFDVVEKFMNEVYNLFKYAEIIISTDTINNDNIGINIIFTGIEIE